MHPLTCSVLTAALTVGCGAGWAAPTPGTPSLVAPPVAVSTSVVPGAMATRADHDWPLRPRPAVARPYEAPPQPWAPGHRGVDLVSTAGATVHASGPGVVSFAGSVAGRRVVTITHPDGLRTTYEPLAPGGADTPTGTAVERGDSIGTLAAAGSHCAPRACLHWGLVLADTGGHRLYGDPLRLLGLVPRVILLPLGD